MNPRLDRLERQLFGSSLAEIEKCLSGHVALRRCWRLLQASYLEPLDLRTAGDHCRVERSTLNRLLRQAIGLTFHQLLIRRRLLDAAYCLVEDDKSTLDVALDCGFGSVRALERATRRHFGRSPKGYRMWAREGETPRGS